MKTHYLHSKNIAVQCSGLKDLDKLLLSLHSDSGTLMDHIYTNTKLSVKTDVNDCYYTDHDYVLCTISKEIIST